MLNFFKLLFRKPAQLRRVDLIQDDVYIPRTFHIERHKHKEK